MQLLNSAGCALSKGYPIAVSAVRIVVVYLSEPQNGGQYHRAFFSSSRIFSLENEQSPMVLKGANLPRCSSNEDTILRI